MADEPADVLGDVAQYYAEKLAAFGETARGVDWNGPESQTLRFEQLARVIGASGGFSLNDLGCGYGALLDFLSERYRDFSYRGSDISPEMVEAAAKRYAGRAHARFACTDRPAEPADYGIASGIFNVRLGCGDSEWLEYVTATLDVLDATSTKGFAFNCLTSYSDREKMRDYLYYADPRALFDLCKTRYSRNVALLHDYDLYEFTILVRKTR